MQAETVVVWPVHLHGWLRVCPRAIEQAEDAVVKDVCEGDERGVVLVADAVANVFRDVERQGAVRAKQAEAEHTNRGRCTAPTGLYTKYGRGRKDGRRVLAQSHRVVARGSRIAEPWPIIGAGLNKPQQGEQVNSFRRVAKHFDGSVDIIF